MNAPRAVLAHVYHFMYADTTATWHYKKKCHKQRSFELPNQYILNEFTLHRSSLDAELKLA